MVKKQSFVLALLLLASIVLLSGCGVNQDPITSGTPGIWNHYFIYPFSFLLTSIANFFNGSYGIAIMIMTLLVRFALLPLMLSQQKSQQKMQALQPKMQALREKYKSKDQETMQKLQKETMKLYQENGVNPVSMGCLPMLIQLPILMAFYYAIRRTGDIAAHTFLWFKLGVPDPTFILPLLVGVTSYFQFITSPAASANPQMAMMKYIMPGMMIFVSISIPSALPLYWFVGNLFMIGQNFLLHRPNKQPGLTQTR